MEKVKILVFGMLYGIQIFAVESDASAIQKLFRETGQAHVARGGFTQTTAQMSLAGDRQKIKSELSGFAAHESIIKQALAREDEYKRQYDVFYTVQPCTRLLQDVMRELYMRGAGAVGALKNNAFQFLRFAYQNRQYDQFADVQTFMKYALLKNGVIFDAYDKNRVMVPVDISLFGNPGTGMHTMWMRFVNPSENCQSEHMKKSMREELSQLLASYGHASTYVGKLVELNKYLVNRAGNSINDFMQIFVPENMVNANGFYSWHFGVPYDQVYINAISQTERLKNRSSLDAHKHAIVMFSRQYMQSQTAQKKAVDDLIGKVIAGDLKLEQTLYQYRTQPDLFGHVDYMQARLLVTNKELLNPASGIMIYRYSQIDQTKEAQYKIELDRILQQMDIEKQARDYIRR